MKQSWPIPAHLIRKEHVEYENEVLSALGASVAVGIRLLSKPFSIGVMSLLEIMDNKLIKQMFTGDESIEPDMIDLYAVFYMNHYRKAALEEVREWYRGDKEKLDKKILEFGESHKINAIHSKYVIDQLTRSGLGYKMIPGNGGTSEMIYSAEALAGTAYIACSKLNIDYDTAIWETPMTLLGHISALSAIENGTKNVERPHDKEHLEELEALCEKCDDNEELYPWQSDRPFKIGVFQWQTEIVLNKWVEAARRYIAEHGEDDKQNEAEITRVKGMYKDIRYKYLKELKNKR